MITSVVTGVLASGCADGYAALGTHKAEVIINGVAVDPRPRIDCEQVGWTWHIETLRETPGFEAQVNTGPTVQARAVQIDGLGTFSGSFWDETVGDATAEIVDGTLIVVGTAEGYYQDAPAERATARFAIRTDC